jgi:membrane protease YdiL (CAAX protease family)
VSEAPESRWPPWYGPLALVMGLVFGLVGGSIAVIALPHAVRGGGLSPAATDVATVIQDLGFVGAALLLAVRVAPLRPRQFGLVRPRSLWRAVVIVPAALALVSLLAYAWFQALDTSGQEKQFVKEIGGNAGTVSVLAVCALVCVVAPICEELLFRGFIYRSLANWRGPWPAAIATGILFGVVHGLSAPVVDLVPLALLGVVLCLIYQSTGSLYPCMAVHLLNNALALGSDENWGAGRVIALMAGGLVVVTLVLAAVRLASERWTPATG